MDVAFCNHHSQTGTRDQLHQRLHHQSLGIVIFLAMQTLQRLERCAIEQVFAASSLRSDRVHNFDFNLCKDIGLFFRLFQQDNFLRPYSGPLHERLYRHRGVKCAWPLSGRQHDIPIWNIKILLGARGQPVADVQNLVKVFTVNRITSHRVEAHHARQIV